MLGCELDDCQAKVAAARGHLYGLAKHAADVVHALAHQRHHVVLQLRHACHDDHVSTCRMHLSTSAYQR